MFRFLKFPVRWVNQLAGGRKRSLIKKLSLCAILSPTLALSQVPDNSVRFHLHDDFLIVVPVMLNGTGPYDFLLDTGSTSSLIDSKLAASLNAPTVGGSLLASITSKQIAKRVRLEQVSLGNAKQAGLGALVDDLDGAKSLVPGIRGILGEDFLENFDFLIDYKRRVIAFGPCAFEGERLAFLSGTRYQGSKTAHRLLLPVSFSGEQRDARPLQLDSGARLPVVFQGANIRLPSFGAIIESGAQTATGSRNGVLAIYPHVSMRAGRTVVYDQKVAKTQFSVMADSEGLLPTGLFRRVYISHSGGFVILNPADPLPVPETTAMEASTLAMR